MVTFFPCQQICILNVIGQSIETSTSQWWTIRADSGPLQVNTIVSHDQFKPIRIGENLVVSYNEL